MIYAKTFAVSMALMGALLLNGCTNNGSNGATQQDGAQTQAKEAEGEKIWDLFKTDNSNTQVLVNKYLWQASLDTLNFLPLKSADPFTGMIIFDWGRAPGSSTEFSATVNILSAGLEASSLRVAIQSRSGAASAQTQREIENAILTRARQLRIDDRRR